METELATPAIPALIDFLNAQRSQSHRVLHHLIGLGRAFLLQSDLRDAIEHLCGEDPTLTETVLARTLSQCQEAAIDASWVYLALRRRIARWEYLRIHLETMDLHEVSVAQYLAFKEHLATGGNEDPFGLEIDMAPFDRERYKLREEGSIGRGVEFLNRSLSSRLFEEIGKGDQRLLHFLRVHSYRGQQLMLSDAINSVIELRNALRQALIPLRRRPAQTPASELTADLRALGFEPGWGNDVGRVRDSMGLLLDILEAPSPQSLEQFLSRVPMIFSIAILSPHGWFGQSNVLGRPDTGGQVVYILDQVRALEREMHQRLAEQGIDLEPRVIVLSRLIPEAEGTSCNQRLEPQRGDSAGAVPQRCRRGDAALDLPLSHLALPGTLCPGRRARTAGGTRRPARPDHRQLLGRQPGGLTDGASARRQPVQHRPRAGKDQVPVLRPLLARQRGALPLLGPVHRRPDRDEQCRLHYHQHLSGDRRHRRQRRSVREL
jgi:sucrose synthase